MNVNVYWELNPDSLEELPVLLTSEPSLQSQAKRIFKKSIMCSLFQRHLLVLSELHFVDYM